MVTWDQIVATVQGFFEWLSGVGAGLTDTLGELGSWLFGGLQWLGDRFKEAWEYFTNWLYEGIKWLADQLYNAYNWLATQIANGLAWIGSGLSWIGEQIYNFGQWLYNGIVWVAQTIWNTLVGIVNWIIEQLRNAWNSIIGFANGFINSFNQTINDWVKGLRDKFKYFILINTTVPTVLDAYYEFVKEPSLKKLLGILTVPIFGAITAELIDSIVPRPHSRQVIIYPPFNLPFWEYSPFTPTLPEFPEKPVSPGYLTPPTIGHRPIIEKTCYITTDYEIIHTLHIVREYVNSIKTAYEIALSSILHAESVNKVVTELEYEALPYKLAESVNKVSAIPEIFNPFEIFLEVENKVASEYNVESSVWTGKQVWNYVGTEYEAYTGQIRQLLLESLVLGYPSLIPSIGVSMESIARPATQIDVYLPSEAPPEEGGVGTSYEIQVISPSSVVSQTNTIGTEYTIGGNVIIALIEAIIYLGTLKYATVETSHPFGEEFTIQGVRITKYEPDYAMFEDWTILA